MSEIPQNPNLKIHRVLYDAVLEVLDLVFGKRYLADKVIEKVLKSQPKWGARDRAFIATSSYEIIRNWRLLHHLNGKDISDDQHASLPEVFAAYLWHKSMAIPDWQEFESFDQQYAAIQLHLAKNSPEILLSIPDWLHKYGMEQLPDRWLEEMTAMHGQAPVFVRVNTLKSTPKELIKSLRQNDIEARQSRVVENALEIMGRPNLFRTEAFKEGAFEVQDISSQMATLALDPRPGERVIDACAGAGGKSLHIAMQMENKGHLISMDTEIKKLETLRQRARRAGISNLETRAIESSKTIKRLANSADRLILDVPCTGSGVYRRNPDAKYRLSPEFVQNILQVQSSILNDYGKMLKPGGTMVYATCSLFPDENERQVEVFMAKNAETFELISSQSISTAATGQDGFFIAKFKKLGK